MSFNLKTQQVLDSLPVTAISYTDTLNAAGNMTCTVPLNAPAATPDRLFPGGAGLVVLRDGEPIWGGILWTLNAELEAGTLTLNASGFHSHLKAKHFIAGETARDVDQNAMVRNWIERSNANGGIATDTTKIMNAGRKRTRVWTRYELKNVGDAIEEVAEVIDGFNFRYAPYWVERGKRIGNRFLISPRAGTPVEHRLEHRLTCNVTSVSYDGTALATNAYAMGADNGAGEKLLGSAHNAELAERIPARDGVATFNDVKETRTLLSKAQAMTDAGREPVAIPTLTLYPGMNPADFTVGEAVTVRVDSGYVKVLADFIITERKVDVDATGREDASLSLANRELFTNGNS
ncbi:hypothetical protein [Streptomyces sp. A1-5]|uniref:hypothetical protein n=1 Tax=Streptomyces sp. A1-5 TaxID=2738410 RepID=UPI001F2F5998|nr:hypothetical protein [Streptomyces sp. A1-5]